MASAFEAFMQTELPLRPFAPADGKQESIAIRRGPGPRQMLFLDLADGEVLGRVDGQIRGVAMHMNADGSAGGIRHFIFDVAAGAEQSTWVLNHKFNSLNCVSQVYQLNDDGSLGAMIPDSIKLVDANNVELKFSTAIAGKAVLSFVD